MVDFIASFRVYVYFLSIYQILVASMEAVSTLVCNYVSK